MHLLIALAVAASVSTVTFGALVGIAIDAITGAGARGRRRPGKHRPYPTGKARA